MFSSPFSWYSLFFISGHFIAICCIPSEKKVWCICVAGELLSPQMKEAAASVAITSYFALAFIMTFTFTPLKVTFITFKVIFIPLKVIFIPIIVSSPTEGKFPHIECYTFWQRGSTETRATGWDFNLNVLPFF